MSSTSLEVRVIKRQKIAADGPQTNGARRTSKIFTPFRTIGLVSPTAVPFTSLPLGKTTFQITTSIGKCLQTFDLKRGLHLVFISSPPTPELITATTAWQKSTLAAWGNGKRSGVWVFQRGKKINELEMPMDAREEINQLLVFGPWIIGCCQTRIEVWKADTTEHYTTIHSRTAGKQGGFSGVICNMPTFLNKIFVGKVDGSVEIWNISTGKLIYTLLPSGGDYGRVTAIQPTPVLSLVAIAYETGPIIIRNVKTDREIISFNAGGDERVAVTSITFRTDEAGAGEDGRKSGVMATASRGTGDVTFWDLNKGGRKMGVLRGAHSPPSAQGDVSGGISKAEFLAGQQVLVTSGMDNALKTWIFDDMPFSPIPRILHTRGGHAAPVSTMKFLPTQSDGSDSTGKWLLSSSRDRSFWGWSLRRDGQSSELSQGNIRSKAKKAGILNASLDISQRGTTLEELKAPRITSIACTLNRDGNMGAMSGVKTIWSTANKPQKADASSSSSTGWESVVTGHEGDKFARTWFWGRKRAGRWKFPTSDGTDVSSIGISPCGTFALVGSSGGIIDMHNLQSGLHRQRFPTKLTPKQAKELRIRQLKEAQADSRPSDAPFARGDGAHTGPITGIEVDSSNKVVVSCGADGKVKFWDFAKGYLLHELDWSLTSISGLRFHRPSDLIALSCDDGSIRIIDIETRRLVRELWGAKKGISDFVFSSDGRWILSADGDHVIRTHDLATGHLIEALRFRSKPVAIAFSTTGEYLATAHEDSVGVHLWNNRTLFAHVPTRRIHDNDIIDIDAPNASGENGTNLIEAAFEEDAGLSEEEEDYSKAGPSSIDQISTDLQTLSLVPKARWQTLLHLETIRERNKPIEAPKKPKAAPFFLPSLPAPGADVNNTALVPATGINNEEEPPAPSRITKIANPLASSTTKFTTLLASPDSTILIAHLSALPPSAADVAIRTLDPAAPYAEPVAFVHALTRRLCEKRDFELVQTWMAVFLRCHGSLVTESTEVREALEEWNSENEKERKRVGELVGYLRGVVGWVGGVV